MFPKKAFEPIQEPPDFEKIHIELLHSGVTLRILWDEHRDECLTAKRRRPCTLSSISCTAITLTSTIHPVGNSTGSL